MIWVLFSVENEYDQPPNNLVAWWLEKPTLEVLSKAMGINFPPNADDDIARIVHIWSGRKIRAYNADYRLVQLKKEGAVTYDE